MRQLSFIDVLALILLIIGGLNWGLVGLFNFNLVEYLFGQVSLIAMSIYGVVAIAALYKIYKLLKQSSESEKETVV